MNVSRGMKMSMREGRLNFQGQSVGGFGQGPTLTTGCSDENYL